MKVLSKMDQELQSLTNQALTQYTVAVFLRFLDVKNIFAKNQEEAMKLVMDGKGRDAGRQGPFVETIMANDIDAPHPNLQSLMKEFANEAVEADKPKTKKLIEGIS